MAQDTQITRDEDRSTVHHFIRLFGRAPTDEELVRFRDARARSGSRHSLRLRRRAARLIVRI